MKTSLWAPIALALAFATGCDSADSYDSEDFSERATCAVPSGAGIVGLTDVVISGNAGAGGTAIVGDYASVFANYGVTLAGDYYIGGDAVSPTSVTVNGVAGTLIGNELVEGSYVSVTPPYADANDAAVSNDNSAISSFMSGDKLMMTGGEAAFPGGVYYFEDGIQLSGLSTLTIQGDVVIYVNGSVSFSGLSEINTDGGAYRVELISISSDSISISGSSQVTMNVFAPLAEVSMSGTSGFEGTVLGDVVTLTGGNDFTTSGDAISYLGTCSGNLPGLPGQPD
jgi:hypothetical protein